jgi:hypothetical protein
MLCCPAFHREYTADMGLAVPLTLRGLLGTLAFFYQHPLSDSELEDVHSKVPADDDYRADVLEAAAAGQPVHWCDVLGSPPAPRGAITFTGRDDGIFRPPLFCSGLVRFEGLRRMGPGQYELILGS